METSYQKVKVVDSLFCRTNFVLCTVYIRIESRITPIRTQEEAKRKPFQNRFRFFLALTCFVSYLSFNGSSFSHTQTRNLEKDKQHTSTFILWFTMMIKLKIQTETINQTKSQLYPSLKKLCKSERNPGRLRRNSFWGVFKNCS